MMRLIEKIRIRERNLQSKGASAKKVISTPNDQAGGTQSKSRIRSPDKIELVKWIPPFEVSKNINQSVPINVRLENVDIVRTNGE